MSSIRSILDTNDETVYPQTVTNAVINEDGINLQHIIDSLVYVGEKGKFDEFGDIDMTLNPVTLEDMDIGNTIVDFPHASELYGIDSGDTTKDIVAQLQLAIEEIQKLRETACYPNILINTNFADLISQEDNWSAEYSTADVANRPLDCWDLMMKNKSTNSYLNYSRQTGFIRLTLSNNTGTTKGLFYQSIENPDMYRNKDMSISLRYRLNSGEATIYYEYLLSGGGSNATSNQTSLIADAKWHTVTLTYNISTSSSLTRFCPIVICIGGSSNYQKTQIDLEYVKAERSSYPTPYQTKSIGEELRDCQRYFYSFHEYEQGESCHFLAVPGETKNTLISLLELPITMYDVPDVECGPFTETAQNPSSMVAWSKTTSTLNIIDMSVLVRDTRRIVLQFTVDYTGGASLPDVPYTIILNELMYIDVKAFIK